MSAAAAPVPSRAAFAFIFVTVMLDMLALGTIIPVLPMLVVEFKGGDTASAAQIYGVFGIAWALMQFIFSPLLGVLSDRVGRRPVILISIFGLGLDYILMALAPSLVWLFIGRVISGITAATISTGFAYVADVTPPAQRAGRFGLLGAAFGAGFVFGPALGGAAGVIDPRLPFWIAAGLSLANTVYGYFILPESLPRERRSASFDWRRANPVGSLILLRAHRELAGLAGANFLANLAHAVLPSVMVLYMAHRYGFNELQVGLIMAAVGVSALIVQGALVRPVVARFGERTALIVGLTCGALGFAIYAFAPTGTVFALGIPLMSLWGMAGPSAQGLMSARVGASEQGQLQGANGSIMGVANMIGPGLYTQAFALAIAPGHGWQLSGAPFIIAGLLLAAAAAAAWLSTRPDGGTRKSPHG
ncbi:MAG: TCR/Tet family MFS transporter [Proteobacteria bacterium]|nr:TCR/Tet family MFS transporter [Pseudomonadota bacterium]